MEKLHKVYIFAPVAPGRSLPLSLSFRSNDRYSFAFSPNDLSPAKGTCFLAFSFSILVVQISSNDLPLPVPSRGFLGKGSDTKDVGDIGLSMVDLSTPSFDKLKSDFSLSVIAEYLSSCCSATSSSTLSLSPADTTI